MALFRRKPKDKLSIYIYAHFGVYPKQIQLYQLAFTHKSFDQNKPNNERLEFLGDSVIDTIVAEYIYERFPGEDEGFLTKLRSRIVSRENLNDIGTKLQVLEHVKYYKGNNQYKSLEGNVFEALVGAVYLDFGYVKTKTLIYTRVLDSLVDVEHLSETDTDYKSQVLIWSQKNNRKVEYKVSEADSKSKKYLAKLYVDGELISESTGRSKKEAEKQAAKSAIGKLT